MPAPATPSDSSFSPIVCDLLVVGSGAGGLSAAVTAALHGLSVVVVEKDAQFGGTTAWSGGWMWVPRNPLARAAGIDEDIAQPLSYLRHELGEHFDEALARTYLEAAPRMVAFFQERTALRFIGGTAIPDFHGRTPDAGLGGRSVCAAPFDGRQLGAARRRLRDPLPETTLWGMGIASGVELRHFLDALRKPASFAYVARRMLAHWRDLLLHGRSQRLVNGHALAGALAASALAAGVQLRTGCAVTRLLRDGQRVLGAVVQDAEGSHRIMASRGVVLACGGFAHDAARKKALLPHAPNGTEHCSAAVWSNTGDGLRLGESAGAVVDTTLVHGAALAPVSIVPRRDGSVAHFPHLIERAKPGLIAVRADGRRFTNEADSYYDFMRDLLAATPRGEPVQAWLLCDHAFVRHYGLGAVKPAPMPLGPWLRNGYLRRGRSLAELARTCGIDAAGLEACVARYNAMAHAGRDEDFAKGETPYNRMQGDAAAGHANACMAPLQRGPFYAVRVVPGSLGTFAGLKTDADARVLDAQGQPIAGLYAAGNDMNSMMGGRYPSGGITLGPAMTFGHLAGLHAAAASPASSPAQALASALAPSEPALAPLIL